MLVCLSQIVSKLFADQVFWLDHKSIAYHENNNYSEFTDPSHHHPEGFFRLESTILNFNNSKHQNSQIKMLSLCLSNPAHRTQHTPLQHNMHLVYFLGANSTLEHKAWDWKVFAMTGLTIHGANYPSNKYCFQDLVLFGIEIVHNLIHQKNIRPENIILYGDSFGGATAEYVFQHYANRKTYLASRIVSNSFTSLDKVITDMQERDVTHFFGVSFGYIVKSLILPYWNATPIATTHLYPSQLFISNRSDDKLLSDSQLIHHTPNQIGLLNQNIFRSFRERYNNLPNDIFHSDFDKTFDLQNSHSSPHKSHTMMLLIWAARILLQHQKLRLRHNTSEFRRQQIRHDSHCAMYVECDPESAAIEYERKEDDSSFGHGLAQCQSGPHNTELMLSAVLTNLKITQSVKKIHNKLWWITQTSAWKKHQALKINKNGPHKPFFSKI